MDRSRPLEERQTRRSRMRTPSDRASRGRLLHRRDDLPPAPTRSLPNRVGQPLRPSCRLHRPPQRGDPTTANNPPQHMVHSGSRTEARRCNHRRTRPSSTVPVRQRPCKSLQTCAA
jgi:hypothetical protein